MVPGKCKLRLIIFIISPNLLEIFIKYLKNMFLIDIHPLLDVLLHIDWSFL